MSDPSDFVNTPDPQKPNNDKPKPPSSALPDLAGAGTDGASLVPERYRLRLEYEAMYGGSDEWPANSIAVLEEPEVSAPDAAEAPLDTVDLAKTSEVKSTASEFYEQVGVADEPLTQAGDTVASALCKSVQECAAPPVPARPSHDDTPREAPVSPGTEMKTTWTKPVTLKNGTVVEMLDPNAPPRLRDKHAWWKQYTLAEQVMIHCLRFPVLFEQAQRTLFVPFPKDLSHFNEVWRQAAALVKLYGTAVMGSDWRGILEQHVRVLHDDDPTLDPELTLARQSLFEENDFTPYAGSFFDRVFDPPPQALSLDAGRQHLKRLVYATQVYSKATDILQRMKDPAEAMAELSTLVQKCQAVLAEAPPPFMTPVEFEQTEFELDWLVPKVLVAGQPAIIGGPSKAMKTSVMIDLAVSIGAGDATRFLSHFEVGQPGKPVGFISAESGGATIKETFHRVCQARGVELGKCNVYPEFRLPKLSQSAEISRLVAAVKRHGLQVLVVDPIYLSLLAGDQDRRQPRQASNVFDMGPLLGDITQAFQEAGCTLILVHHTVKHLPGKIGDRFEPLDREHLAMAGFAEFARQWLLVNRREPYEDGTGQHKLWLRLGGSAGFGSLWGVDIDEGVIDDNFCGRQWKVQVRTAGELKTLEHQQVEHQQQQKQKARQEQDEIQILGVLKEIPSGETATEIRKAAGISNSRSIMAILNKLCQAGKVELVKIKKQAGRGLHDVDAYRLKHAAMLAGSNEEPPQEEGAEQ